MNKKTKVCIHCGDEFNPNPKVKNQEYCSKQGCQRARRARWQREKMKGDPDYQEDKRRNEREWHKKHPGYYKEWRAGHPEYVERNRSLQQIRNTKLCKDKVIKMIAKLYLLDGRFYSRMGSTFKLIPQDNRLIAKLDSLTVKLIPVQRVMK